VDRLTTGRRHVRAGSVTVTELITRQTSPTLCLDSSATEPDDDITDTIPVVVAAAHRREPAKGAQLAKLASLGMAGAVLCGAVTVSSMIAHQRRDGTHQALRPISQITGEQALLPDRLDETLPKAPAPAPPVVQERATPSTPVPVPPPATPDSFPGGTTASDAVGAVGSRQETDLDLVREFYENLPESPAEAFRLLSSDLMNAGVSEFLASWSRVVSIDSVDVLQRADGVLATVQMRLLGGDRLRTQQLLTVAESPRRIVGVQLLSAQRN
jgi:hypothetical protein